jgi:osomolarity two-component system response regulator SKN7
MYPPQPQQGAEGMYATPQHSFSRTQPSPSPMQMSNGVGAPRQGWNDAYGPPPPGSAGHSVRNGGPPEGFYPPPPPTAGGSGPPGPGWSSVHPSANSKNGLPRSRGGQTVVKTEDMGPTERLRGRPPTAGNLVTTVPLGQPDMRPQTAQGGGGDAGAQAGPSEFIKKLYKMLEEESAMYGRGKPAGQPRPEGAQRGSVGWGRGGSSFVVWDMNEFTTKVL